MIGELAAMGILGIVLYKIKSRIQEPHGDELVFGPDINTFASGTYGSVFDNEDGKIAKW